MDSAAKLISENGFFNTTMDEIIAGTSLSKGGVYYYYKNVVDIFRDLMLEGIKYRENIISKKLIESKENFSQEFIIKEIVNKILADNKYMPLYVEFLISKKKSSKLNNLMKEFEEKTKDGFKTMFKNFDLDWVENENNFEILTDFINSMIISANVLEARERLKNNRTLLEQMISLIFKNQKEEKNESI